MKKWVSGAAAVVLASGMLLGGSGAANAAISVFDGYDYGGDVLYSGTARYADLWDNKASSVSNSTRWRYSLRNVVNAWTDEEIYSHGPYTRVNLGASDNNKADHLKR